MKLNENTQIDLSFLHWSQNLLHPHEQVRVSFSNKIFISLKKNGLPLYQGYLPRIFPTHLKWLHFLIEKFEANVNEYKISQLEKL